METSGLLPTPTARDWKGAGKKPRDTLDSLIENGATKRRSGLSIVLPGVFPVSRFPMPDKEEARQMTAGSGLQCLALYNKHARHGLSLRTFSALLLGSTAWYSNKCTLTWKAKTMTSKRLLFRLLPSTRRIEGTESGLLRTPLTKEPGIAIERVVNKDGHPYQLGQTAYDRRTGRHAHIGLTHQLGNAIGGKLRLEPAFPLWMMGLPEHWLTFPMEPLPPKPDGAKKR